DISINKRQPLTAQPSRLMNEFSTSSHINWGGLAKCTKATMMITRSILFLVLLLQSNLPAYTLPPNTSPAGPSASLEKFALPLPPDPKVIHQTSSSLPPTLIAIKFQHYGKTNYLPNVQQLLHIATFDSHVHRAHKQIAEKPPLYYSGPARLALQLEARNGMTWGQWKIVLNAIEEFLVWYQSVDFSFVVMKFEEGKAGIELGDGFLWTGAFCGQAHKR
ncbi:MAG: hypothetical protein Q9182_007416, partial [Xanthomendoza sp. 2 TL-2023]